MPERAQFLARLYALVVLAAGLAFLVNRDGVISAIDGALHDAALMWCFGVLAVAAGGAAVLGHTRWRGWRAALVSLMSWGTLLKGLALMLLPNPILIRLYEAVDYRGRASLWGIAAIGIGLLLAVAGGRRTG